MAGAGNRMSVVTLHSGLKVKVYARRKTVAKALDELTEDMDLYHGVRLGQLLEALYEQGLKDGARKAFDALDDAQAIVKEHIRHRTPGRPKKK